MANGFTKKQELFIAEYLIGFNATRAAIAAGYSRKGAEVTASQLLRNPKVAAEIEKKFGKRLDKLEITADKVLKEIAKIAFFDPRKLFNSDGSPKQILELDDDTAAGVVGLEVCELFEGAGDQKHAYALLKKIKLADKGQNLERLGRHEVVHRQDRAHRRCQGVVHGRGACIEDRRNHECGEDTEGH
jgi:phage terminase small subunit